MFQLLATLSKSGVIPKNGDGADNLFALFEGGGDMGDGQKRAIFADKVVIIHPKSSSKQALMNGALVGGYDFAVWLFVVGDIMYVFMH